MKCLAVNTANTLLSVALVDGADVLYRFSTPETRDQGNLLILHARQALAENNIGFNDLDLMAVVTGPGSFTGIRIGIAGMRGFALAAAKPLVGISSFELFTREKNGFENIIAIESWREELYFRYAGQTSHMPPVDFAEKLPAGKKYLISGDARQKLSVAGAVQDDLDADAVTAATLAIEKFKRDGAKDRPAPFYMRDADVTMSTKNIPRTVAEH